MKYLVIDMKEKKIGEKDLDKMDRYNLVRIARETRAVAESEYVKAYKAEAKMMEVGKTIKERSAARKEMLHFRKEAAAYLLGAQAAWRRVQNPSEAEKDFARPDTIQMMDRAKKVARFHL